jgi:hypothetical protein
VVCHEFLGGDLASPVAAWQGSIHQQNGITCAFCHGGDAGVEMADLSQLSGPAFGEKASQAMAPAQGFIGRPSGQAQFDMCAQCHSGSVARYAASIMGQAYLDNQGGPSCVACHRAHDNVMPEVPQSCEGCHQDTTGYARIDPMNVTAATVNELAAIRIRLAGEKTRGPRPQLAPAFPEESASFLVGLLAFGAVLVLLLLGWPASLLLAKGKKDEL